MVNRFAVSFQNSKSFLGCGCQRGDLLRDFYPKTVAVFLETKSTIERMGIITVQIA